MPIYLNPSLLLVFSYSLMLLGGEICIFCADLSVSWQIILGLLIICYSFWLLWAKVLLRQKHAIVGLCRLNEYDAWLILRSGSLVSGQMIKVCIIAQFCVLRFYVPSMKRTLSCTIAKDAIVPDQFRRLVMILRTLTL